MSEEELIKGLKQQDVQAFNILFKEYYPALLFFAIQWIKDSGEAEHLVMDVFMILWQRKDDFESLIYVKAWLYKTTKNKCLNYLDHLKRRKKRDLQYTKIVEQELLDNAEHLQIQTELLRMIMQEVNELPEKCKQVFILIYLHGLKNCEAAEELGVTESTVRSLRAYAINKLKVKIFEKESLLAFVVLLLQYFT